MTVPPPPPPTHHPQKKVMKKMSLESVFYNWSYWVQCDCAIQQSLTVNQGCDKSV